FFGGVPEKKEEIKTGTKQKSQAASATPDKVVLPLPGKDDEVQVIAGSAQLILDNMNSSLSIPVATSQRFIAVKLLEENRTLLNRELKKRGGGKISYTHIIAWAIIQGVKKIPSMNNAFTIIEEKPRLIKRKQINLGLAIDIEKRDGSRSLIVPNIKNCEALNFKEFVDKYNDIVKRTRTGQIDPSEFAGTTITLTNPGTIGTISSIPRLMVGQSTIIATGSIQYPVEYEAMSPEIISTLGISKVMGISSTYDHRIIQGAESGLFLKEISTMLLGEEDFFKDIFASYKIPNFPLKWKTDYSPGVFSRSENMEEIEKQARILQMINMYRVRGHLIANLDPLGKQDNYHPELDPANYKLTIWDYDREFIAGGYGGIRAAPLREILDMVQKTYCDKIGVEYMHIQNPREKAWLQNHMEPVKNTPFFGIEQKKTILQKLILAEAFEHFIHHRFVGHKRFSLEGSETLLPVLDMLLNEAIEADVQEVVFGMSHRGRLNVLANVIGKTYESIFSEFEDIKDLNSIQGSGDVKYHLGASGKYSTRNGRGITVSLASNPSHLEWVNPVVEGIVRAKQTRQQDVVRKKSMALLIHGDAAFAGQGIVAETLNLSQLKGYRTGGTVHIIVNNQIGFTTTPDEARSSEYATDVAKMIQSPIFHVNGDDPEAALWVTKLAFAYRQEFQKDVVIDLFGYRRHGHNEGDEPGFTQPLLYNQIKAHPTVREIYAKILVSTGVMKQSEIDIMAEEISNKLSKAFDVIKQKSASFEPDVPLAVSKEKMEQILPVEDTSINEEALNDIVKGITSVPESFNVHPKLQKFLEKRKTLIGGDTKADWAFAELIAFGSLLYEGTPVRLSGQDSVRGTFSQRHIALTDIHTGEQYIGANYINDSQEKIEPLDSFLSEAAVLGFEYGYSTADPLALVLWEAQFGDFANGAQVIIDNFIVASYEKWHLPNSVVMLLPHGYEGQGPEHSSARLERFLILCAEDNIQVCNITTPAQYFHLLRRQIKHDIRRPLIIMTPKSLLRHPEAVSPKEEFLNGKFVEILDDDTIVKKEAVKRLILTSGKVFYDLMKQRREANLESDTAIIRVEQFYPLRSDLLTNILTVYSAAKKIVWVQEEPKNMGAWNFIAPRLIEYLSGGQKLLYSGRPESASPAYGSSRVSAHHQKDLVEKAFTI
ncbi:MAG: multifunctional oxoglutarate decarboxylase/oxoglutarate dehydrogenase thiamine pyrophosphate-binding subunit/dihydrolipoyllysine-residue succinyltransferase subunit, partial [Ignavibacteriaceae bacterium]|nr:multifunctional oxoglutarate decarboxylase/oxoglutarate dehydrogenase thiamine pyrophosphate-binding subunit/dihydrolipoyllysine-residue succinyltransferase subunit [Ignavibacteriaceae bacterium]